MTEGYSYKPKMTGHTGRYKNHEGAIQGLLRGHGPVNMLITDICPPEIERNKFMLF